MTRRSAPGLRADDAFRAAAEAALAAGTPFELADHPVRVYPPKEGRATWRVVFYAPDRRECSGGRDVDSLFATVVAAVDRSQREHRPQAHRTLEEAREDYLQQHVAGGWDARTCRDRHNDLSGLIRVAGELACAELEISHLRAGLQKASTHGRGTFLAKRYRHFLAWGKRHEYFTAAQVALLDDLQWRAPAGYLKAPSWRKMARLEAVDDKAKARGFVPTHGQVADWADQTARYYKHGQALIHLDSVTGLRFGELMALTADPRTQEAGLGNLVDVDRWLLCIRRELTEGQQHGTEPPKADKVRDVVVPRGDKAPTGFDVRGWLAQRVAEALAEQAAGINPLALIFPAPKGGWWWHSNLRQRVLQPAMDELGWPTTEVVDAFGHSRRYARFTLHSLRDRYACTAVDHWGYTRAQLYQQGGWEDMTTVERYYYGTTDDTPAEVRSLIG